MTLSSTLNRWGTPGGSITTIKGDVSAMNEDVIYAYTIDQATQDGILLDLRKVNPQWERGIFSHVTTNLLSMGYFNEDQTPNLLDLLNQSLEIVRKKSNNFKKFDSFFSGSIELPSGEKQTSKNGGQSIMPRCKSCEAEIRFIRTEKGRMIPVEAKSITVITTLGKTIKAFVPHWTHCPGADAHRKRS